MVRNSPYCAAILMLLIYSSHGYPQTIPFDSDRWEIKAEESEIVSYLGRQSLRMKGGMAIVKDSDFKNGAIEFDIAFTGERGFMGAVWRITDPNNREEFYLRPHHSGNPDANQYTPIFNGASAWQLYHGDGYGAPVDYVFNEWMRVKIVFSGNRGEVYIRDMDKPAVVIHEMKHKISSGQVGLMCANFVPAYFSNFHFSVMENPRLNGQATHVDTAPEGTIKGWSISNAFDEKLLKEKVRLEQTDKAALTWTELESEASGIANLSRVHGLGPGKNTVFARVTVISASQQVKQLQFGYSDRIKVYFNDRLFYSGSNVYRSRDYRYLGTIGYFDELYLPLQRGKNELWLAVSEDFGGWGIQARFADMDGIEVRVN